MTENRQERESAWEYITSLAGGLAHEIKNPLSTIKMNLQLLEEDWADPQTPRERRTTRKLQVVQSEVQRLTQTLEDFLRFTKVERIRLVATDLSDVVAEIAEFVGPELDRNNIQLREEYAPALPLCTADPALLKQALLNIILNAQQAMPEGGEMILRTSCDGEHVRVDVIDTGPGVSDSARDKLYRPFFSTKKDGSGLGLAVTRRIIDQHDGTLTFHSEPNKGTDFAIRLPVREAAADPEDTEHTAP